MTTLSRRRCVLAFLYCRPVAALPSTRRTFISSLVPEAGFGQRDTVITAQRTIPFACAQIYSLIVDIDSYSQFLPNCTASRVTAWTGSPATTYQLPARADMTVGWGPFQESYTSRIYCVPGELVAAVSGQGRLTMAPEKLMQYGYDMVPEAEGDEVKASGLFHSLVTQWFVRPSVSMDKPMTDVRLSVRFQFRSPMLGYAVGQVADEKASELMMAFEARARSSFGSQ